MDVCLRELKESNKSRCQEQSIDYIPYYLWGLSGAHFFREPFLKHPRRLRGSQSGCEKRRDESFHNGRKSPWVPTLTGPFPKTQADAGS